MRISYPLAAALLVGIAGCEPLAESTRANAQMAKPAANPSTVRAEIWADNWFAAYVGDKLVHEDTTPFATERSFNADTFSFETKLPVELNVIIRDYMENESGLEYIGSRRQQIGDGGFAAQFFDAESGELIAWSSNDWRCIAVQRAPLNRECVRSDHPLLDCQAETGDIPQDWQQPGFDDSEWPFAVSHSSNDVRPHGGYRSINWHANVELIWTDDIELDNTLLCRTVIPGPAK